MLFSLKFQRNNRQNALAMGSAKRGNRDKKSSFSLCCGYEATVCYDRARRDTPRKDERDFRTSIPLPQEWPPPQRDSHIPRQPPAIQTRPGSAKRRLRLAIPKKCQRRQLALYSRRYERHEIKIIISNFDLT